MDVVPAPLHHQLPVVPQLCCVAAQRNAIALQAMAACGEAMSEETKQQVMSWAVNR